MMRPMVATPPMQVQAQPMKPNKKVVIPEMPKVSNNLFRFCYYCMPIFFRGHLIFVVGVLSTKNNMTMNWE